MRQVLSKLSTQVSVSILLKGIIEGNIIEGGIFRRG
jgi:hypothetical protein